MRASILRYFMKDQNVVKAINIANTRSFSPNTELYNRFEDMIRQHNNQRDWEFPSEQTLSKSESRAKSLNRLHNGIIAKHSDSWVPKTLENFKCGALFEKFQQ